MRLFDMVMFLVLLGSVSGGIAGALQYVQGDSGVDWWTGYQADDFSTVVVDSSDVDTMNQETGIVSSIEDFYNAVYFAIGLLWNIIKGVFWVKGSILDQVLVYYDDSGNNILEPISYVIQGGIYLIAIYGWYQLKAKQPMGGGY